MLSTILLCISALCFIAVFGIHIYIINSDDFYGYTRSQLLKSIPWLSGHVLAVIPECLVFEIYWIWMFLINLAIVYIIGPSFTRFFIRRLASGKGLGIDMFIALVIAIITLIIGYITI